MTFLGIALSCLAQGFRIHPLGPETKEPLTHHGWKDASSDETQVREWWRKWPSANVGIACGPSGLCVVDCDHGLNSAEEFYAWREKVGLPETYTVRTGRRESFGVHMYYSGAIPTVTWDNLQGCSGDIKSLGGYVLAAGCIHPDSKEKYEVLCPAPIVPTPDMVRAWRSSKPDTGKGDEPITENRNIRLTSIAGKLRNAGLSHDALEAALLHVNAERCVPPMDEEEVQRIADNVAKYPLPEPMGEVIIGKSAALPAETATVEELNQALRATPLPKYPLSVWEGTLYLDFAKRAARGNFVPLEFFIEGAMTCAGAMVANNLHGISEEITPRLYTVLLAFAGIGKGTTFRRIRQIAPSSRLLNIVSELNAPRPHSSVALLARAGSEPGLNDALLACPYVLLDFEEMDRMMEKTRIEGSGAALMSVIRTLFDDIAPGITTTSTRKEAAPVGYLSLLGAMTPSLWRRSMEGQDSYGTGLGGRFNLVATNEERTAATLLPMEIGDLQSTLDAKLAALEHNETTISTEPDALDVLAEWWKSSKGRPHYNRVNVIAHRKALHLAWIRDLPVITKEIMLQAVQLADYLVRVRDAFGVTKGEDRTAIGENRVLHILRQIAPKAVRSRKVVELLDGIMSRASVYRALESLMASGELEKFNVTGDGRPYAIYRISLT